MSDLPAALPKFRKLARLAVLVGLAASGANADAGMLHWKTVEIDGRFATFAFDAETADEENWAESTMFRLECDPKTGQGRLWYVAEDELLPGQTRNGDGMRAAMKVPMTLKTGSAEFPLPSVRVQPEEMYGGNELYADIAHLPDLLGLLRPDMPIEIRYSGQSVGRIDLAGAAESLKSLRTHCRR